MATRDGSRRGNAAASYPPPPGCPWRSSGSRPRRAPAPGERAPHRDLASGRGGARRAYRDLRLRAAAALHARSRRDHPPRQPAGADLLGHQRSRLLGRSLWSFVAPCDREVLAHTCRSALRAGAGQPVSFTWPRPGEPPFGPLSTRVSSRAKGLLQVGVLDLRERDQAREEVRRLVAAERPRARRATPRTSSSPCSATSCARR